jgi:hypothetical protein
MSNAKEAKITVAGTLPASREAVEKMAAAKANANPMAASRNRSHAPEFSERKARTIRLRAPDGAD